MKKYISLDLFCGCGGLSTGMVKAGFDVKAAVDNDADSVKTYRLNHPDCKVIKSDIRKVTPLSVKKLLKGQRLHLLAGCPPCQGFSSVRRRNGRNVKDKRNKLILEYLRFVKKLKPLTIMLENVPGLTNYNLFKTMVKKLNSLGYKLKHDTINIKNYGIPQRRKRLVLIGSLLGKIDIATGNGEKVTVRDAIGNLGSIKKTSDPLHKITVKHTQRIKDMIKLIPKNGGSRSDLPEEYKLLCHTKENVGFNDIYGRLKWDDNSATITGGCLNPSKGRFLHPTENRVITPREAALLQSFPKSYKFPTDIPKASLALLIGNALPPKFSYIQSKNIKKHLDKYLDQPI
ncbi:MAG: DNA cytosine methyltransferase [Planctomycetes bacterium]|nr:DNA cytosine methyltransferase [Planctomycetota bacterium]